MFKDRVWWDWKIYVISILQYSLQFKKSCSPLLLIILFLNFYFSHKDSSKDIKISIYSILNKIWVRAFYFNMLKNMELNEQRLFICDIKTKIRSILKILKIDVKDDLWLFCQKHVGYYLREGSYWIVIPLFWEINKEFTTNNAYCTRWRC